MRWNHFIGAILLIAGTAIGAGMLALPTTTAVAGFFPTLGVLLFSWLYLTSTAYLLLEVNLSLEGRVNLISMAEKTLGTAGKVLCWTTYLLLLYALTAAYLAGSAPFLQSVGAQLFSVSISPAIASLGFLAIFGLVVYRGTQTVDLFNRVCILGLILAYLSLVYFLPQHVQKELLLHIDKQGIWFSIPVIITSFGFHIVIPSLATYLNYQKKKLRRAIFWGSLIPLITYIVWEFLVLGSVPVHGESGLKLAWEKGSLATIPLMQSVQNPSISIAAPFFSFFAIVTSFLGVSLSLFDFLVDGFKVKKTTKHKMRIWTVTFLPPLFFVWFYPKAFILALQYASIFVAILLGILPALMAWNTKKVPFFQTKVGRFFLSFIITISIGVIFLGICIK